MYRKYRAHAQHVLVCLVTIKLNCFYMLKVQNKKLRIYIPQQSVEEIVNHYNCTYISSSNCFLYPKLILFCNFLLIVFTLVFSKILPDQLYVLQPGYLCIIIYYYVMEGGIFFLFLEEGRGISIAMKLCQTYDLII